VELRRLFSRAQVASAPEGRALAGEAHGAERKGKARARPSMPWRENIEALVVAHPVAGVHQ
jgi:hypothetical protein